MAPRIISFTSS